MALSRYFLDIEDRVPAAQLAVLERGAIVNADQSSVNAVTVHAPHEFATSDLFIYAPTRVNVLAPPGNARVFTVSSATATTVTFSGATFSFPDKAMLLNVGVDTGGTQNDDGSWKKLNFDAAAVTVYKDASGDSAWSNSKVDVDPGGEAGFWADGRIVWAVTLDSGNIPLRIYPDMGGTGGAFIRSAVQPTPAEGEPMIWVETAGAPGGGDRWHLWSTNGSAWSFWELKDTE